MIRMLSFLLFGSPVFFLYLQIRRMKTIILHIGDRVKHQSLGDGVVIAVNDDCCTARFGEKEANFRIPEAFVRGYLTSPDAIISSDEGEEQPIEKILPEKKKEGEGCAKAIFIFMGVAIFLPFVAYYVWHYGKTGDSSDLVGVVAFIIALLLYIPFAIRLAKVSGTQSTNKTDSHLDPKTELMAGILGSELIHRSIEKEKQAAEKRRYDSLYWQESIRDKTPRHDFDYDHLDDD